MNTMQTAERQALKAYVSRFVKLTDTAFNDFCERCELHKLEKKQFLFEAGQVCRQQYFVLNGLFRSFYVDEKGNEQVLHFAIENWWTTDYESWVSERPSTLSLQALEPSQVLSISKSQLETLYDQHPMIERLFRLIAEKTYIAAQNRLKYMLSMKREDIHEEFVEVTSGFTERVPQYMVASYLGFTPEFLSMIRAKKRKKKT